MPTFQVPPFVATVQNWWGQMGMVFRPSWRPSPIYFRWIPMFLLRYVQHLRCSLLTTVNDNGIMCGQEIPKQQGRIGWDSQFWTKEGSRVIALDFLTIPYICRVFWFVAYNQGSVQWGRQRKFFPLFVTSYIPRWDLGTRLLTPNTSPPDMRWSLGKKLDWSCQCFD